MTEIRKVNTVLVPPDGGWGWVICFAQAFNNFIIIPVLQNFGLVFKSKFAEIGMSATNASIIINTNSAFGMIMGLVNGSLLKKFGIRKVATAGGILIAGGIILTSFANTFELYFLYYGLIASFGFGMSMAAHSLALNTYFRKRRSRATGFAMTITGLGPIVMPLFLSYLLGEYGTAGCVLIVGGISLNTLVAASLLQPLKWHMKRELVDQELIEMGKPNNGEITESLIQKDSQDVNKFGSTLSIDHDVETRSIYGFETPLPRRKLSQSSSVYDASGIKHRKRTFSRSISQQEKTTWKSTASINSVNSLHSINEEDVNNKPEAEQTEIQTNDELLKLSEATKDNVEIEKPSFASRCVKFFDLDLLRDPIYLNLMLGMSLAIFAEINFSLLTPFILNDINFSTIEVAQIMSTIAAADVVFRFSAPFIADWLGAPAKVMYMFSLILLISSRSALLFVNSFGEMIGVALCLGVAKGFRTIFMSLLIPSYVPIEKLASASGIQMVANGIITMIGGPLLGLIRDVTGSYNKCIIVMNAVTFTTLVMWTIEYIYCNYLKKSKH